MQMNLLQHTFNPCGISCFEFSVRGEVTPMFILHAEAIPMEAAEVA